MPTEPQSQPLVSIIVPVYNAADHIARCIESIRRQTYRNLEIILLNDGSKDVSYAVCQSYAGIDRRIVVIDKNNSGVSATRNLGMQEAHGKYFQFVDADDFIQPYATELLVQKAEASHADMVIAHYNRIEPPVSLPKTMRDTVVERVLDPILDPQHRVQTFGFLMEGPLNKDAFACGLMQEPASFYYGVMWNKLYRAEVWKLLHYPEGRLHEDDFVAHRLFWRCDKVVCLPDVLYNYRLRSGSIMRTSLKPGAFDAVDGLADRYRFYVENGADRSVIDSAYAACWRRYLFLCAKVRQNPEPQLVKAISKEQFLMQGLISYLPNCRHMKMTEKLSAARWAMMPAESLCPAK